MTKNKTYVCPHCGDDHDIAEEETKPNKAGESGACGNPIASNGESKLGCEHGRMAGQICPHCSGINSMTLNNEPVSPELQARVNKAWEEREPKTFTAVATTSEEWEIEFLKTLNKNSLDDEFGQGKFKEVINFIKSLLAEQRTKDKAELIEKIKDTNLIAHFYGKTVTTKEQPLVLLDSVIGILNKLI